jgi:ABC-type iron transport system FetAB ATPase subunit
MQGCGSYIPELVLVGSSDNYLLQIVDLATLTGACVVALGPSIAGKLSLSLELLHLMVLWKWTILFWGIIIATVHQ